VSETVEIDRDVLENLLWFARKGDVTASGRRLRNGFRHVAICSGDHREPGCFSCRTFTEAEDALLR
jgi:hypothetical protein